MEHSLMFPIDALKTRVQAAGLNKAASTGMISQISKISTMEGSMGLWKGVQSVILGAGPAHAVYFGTYEFCKARLISPEDMQTHQPMKTALSGTIVTIVADALMNPFDTVKQRLQLDTNLRVWNVTTNISK
ncbi:AIF_collapsed_G0032170.mRNA.1.CDS.1 [Saccharomyces cerevisiae]|nr:AIF_collapsed_G0032170.mRNA.1.CDS.1 [Saccharomyces cerevisiae]